MDGEVGGMIIRSLRAGDCGRLVEMDLRLTGRSRKAWFEGKLERALGGSDVCISLGAELDGRLVGALLGSVHYGEFGLPEPVAILDTILVDPLFSRCGVASAMFRQLLRNAKALEVECLRTELGYEEQQLAHFLEKQGFVPAPRKVLELSLGSVPAMSEDENELQAGALTPESDSPGSRPRPRSGGKPAEESNGNAGERFPPSCFAAAPPPRTRLSRSRTIRSKRRSGVPLV